MRAINGAILCLVVFVASYCVCMRKQNEKLALKYYFELNQLRFVPPADTSALRIKFGMVAVTSALLAVVGFAVGRMLPQRATPVVHLLGWLALVIGSAMMIQREWEWFLK